MRAIFEELLRRLRQRSTLRGVIGFLVAISIFSVAQGEAAQEAVGFVFDVIVPFVRDNIIPAFLPGGALYMLYEAFRDDGSNAGQA